MRRLSIRILQLRDDERRKIARDLHDSIGQSMAAVAMNLTMLRDNTLTDSIRQARCNALRFTGTRPTDRDGNAHHLAPASSTFLDEAGFVSAAKWYVDGFTKRSQITVKLEYLCGDWTSAP